MGLIVIVGLSCGVISRLRCLLVGGLLLSQGRVRGLGVGGGRGLVIKGGRFRVGGRGSHWGFVPRLTLVSHLGDVARVSVGHGIGHDLQPLVCELPVC